MRAVSYAIAAVLLVLTPLVQTTVLTRASLPLGPPDVLAIVICSMALATGPTTGCAIGFAAGLLADLLSDHALGRLAAVFCLLGYGLGTLREDAERSVWIALLAVVGGGVAAALLFAGTGLLVDDPRAGGGDVLLRRCASAAIYGALLTPFIYPLVARLLGARTRRAA